MGRYGLLYRSMIRRRPDVNVLLLNTHAVKAVQKILEAYRLCYSFNNRRFLGGTIPSSGLVLALALSQVRDTCPIINTIQLLYALQSKPENIFNRARGNKGRIPV